MDPEGSGGEQYTENVPPTPITPTKQLESLNRQKDELKAKHEAARAQLVAAITASQAQLLSASSSGSSTISNIPLPTEPQALVDEFSTLTAARHFLQYLQELQGLTRHTEKVTRSAERAFAAADPGAYLKEFSDAVDAFSHAMGYAIALQQIQDQGLINTAPEVLTHHGATAITRVTSTGNALKGMLSGASQQALHHYFNWPSQLLGTTAGNESSSGGSGEWTGFAAVSADAFNLLQHLFIIELTLQRAMEHKQFAALGSREGPVLWPAEELTSGIASWLQHHFASGLPTDRADKPEWLFVAALKAAKSCAPAAEELQPCVDAHQLEQYYSMQFETARAVGSSAVASVLRNHVLPRLVSLGDGPSWLHFVDEAVKFEKTLAPLRGITSGTQIEDEAVFTFSHVGSVIDVIFEKAEWLEGWLTAEKDDAERQIDAALDAADAWKPASQSDIAVGLDELSGLSLTETGLTGSITPSASTGPASDHEFYPPTCAETISLLITALVRRQNCVFKPENRVQFTAKVLEPALRIFRSRLSAMLVRAEQFEHLLDDTGLPKVGAAVCAAHYLEHSLHEPQGSLLIAIAGDDALAKTLEKEAGALATFRRQWGYKLAKLAVEQFQSKFAVYKKDLTVFSSHNSSNAGILPQGPSPKLLPAADSLQAALRDLALHLDAVLFRDVWRAAALAVNYALFNDVATEAVFDNEGAAQLDFDVNALIGIFAGCTSRPAAHFKESREACRLLMMNAEEAEQVLTALQHGDNTALAGAGIKALNAEQAATVLNRRADVAMQQQQF